MSEKFPQLNKPENVPLPISEARRLNELSDKKYQEHLLLFSRVKNKVLFVNPEIFAPLKLERGKSSPLGLFVEAAFQEKPATVLKRGKRTMETWSQHTRSAILGRMFFTDKNGTIYRDIDLKGVGYFGAYAYEKTKVAELGNPKRTIAGYGLPAESFGGILDEDYSFYNYQLSEDFIRKGIRTARTIAIIKLEELISNGRKIALNEARNQGFLGKGMKPVVEIRAFATKLRIADYAFQNEKTIELMVKDAKKIVSRELGLKETMTNEKYAEWFAETLGRNVALIHKNGWFHDYLTTHNITLDCRIVDLDSVSELTDENDRINDENSALSSLFKLCDQLLWMSGENSRYAELFHKEYVAVFPYQDRKKYFEKIQKKLVKSPES